MESKKVWITKYDIVSLIMIVLFSISSYIWNLGYRVGDYLFFYNRVQQLKNCLVDFNLPTFFYNNCAGYGYGDAFFYGTLSCWLMLPFASFNSNVLMSLSIFVFGVVNILGLKTLFSRFVDRSDIATSILLVSPIGCACIGFCYLGAAALLALGLSYFFIAYCIDFFRDNKDSWKASLFFWFLINTNTVSAFLSFCICILIMLIYFNKYKIKSYFAFALFTIVECSYFIANFLYHKVGIEFNIQHINFGWDVFFSPIPVGSLGRFFISVFTKSKLEIYNWLIAPSFFDLVFLCFTLYILIKNKKQFSFREKLACIIACVLWFIGIRFIYNYLYTYFKFLDMSQYPLRYMGYLGVVLVIVLVRRLDVSRSKFKLGAFFVLEFCLAIFSLVFVHIRYAQFDPIDYDTASVGSLLSNGEFFDKGFKLSDFESSIDTDNIEYSLDKDKLIVKVKKARGSIEVPKLWYNGYKCIKVKIPKYVKKLDLPKDYKVYGVAEVPCKKGEYQAVAFDTSKYGKGTYVVYYEHPYWLWLWMLFDKSTIMLLLLLWFCERFMSN